MKTPFGADCEYFYGDYLRGRNHEECRLLGAAGIEWESSLCRGCPVPGIRRANACQFMRLKPRIARPLLELFRKQMQVEARCEKSGGTVREPHIGCGQCHPLPEVFEARK
jgi:hypothetical protein